jgi:hypothetical protein
MATPFPGVGHAAQLAPQWVGSPLVSTHAPPQLVSPDWHVKPHVPLSQVGAALVGAVQTALLQAPQCEVSFWRSTQEPEQSVVPLPQFVTQLPPAQTSPVLQVLSQVPQWLRSDWVSMQAPEQLV